jgi:hypothetical protein
MLVERTYLCIKWITATLPKHTPQPNTMERKKEAKSEEVK